jgi:hypothetical protein
MLQAIPLKQKRRGNPRLFRNFSDYGRSACGNYGDLFGATHKPGKKNDTGNPEHCLGREAPTGLLNVIVHDVFSILETCADGFLAVSSHPQEQWDTPL